MTKCNRRSQRPWVRIAKSLKLRQRIFWVTGWILLLWVAPLAACKLPVFRYALERWPVDQYRLVALVNDPDSAAVQDAVEALERFGFQDKLNARTEIINLAELTEEQWWQYEGLEGGSKNQLQVYFPVGQQGDRLGWSGELTRQSIDLWATSPVRNFLIDDLSEGVSAVWLLIEGSDPQQNDEIERQLKEALEQANQTIAIPDGVIHPNDAADHFRDNPGASIDDVLRCSVPLRVDFRSRRINPHDPQEVALIAMLKSLGVRGKEPWLVPVFGRGRMLDAIPVDELDNNVVFKACEYMVGECSCTVKAQNPGVDLLLDVDWKSKLGVETLIVGSTQNTSPMMLDVPKGKPAIDAPAPTSIAKDRMQKSNRPVLGSSFPQNWNVSWRWGAITLAIGLTIAFLYLPSFRKITHTRSKDEEV